MDTWHSIVQELNGHMSWSRGVKNWPLQSPLLPSLAGGREPAPGSYVLPGTLREKERSRPLEPGLGLPVLLQFLSSCGVSLQAGRALNARPIHCCVGQITVVIWRANACGWCVESSVTIQILEDTCKLLIKWLLEVGVSNRVQQFGSDSSGHM